MLLHGIHEREGSEIEAIDDKLPSLSPPRPVTSVPEEELRPVSN
jgi:hypothetical protein